MKFNRSISILFPCIALFAQVQTYAVQSVNLAWDASADSNVRGYVVYYGTTSHGYDHVVPVGNTTNATINGIPEGVTCYFAVAAYDAIGLESDYSNEVTYSIPTIATPTVAKPTMLVQGQGTISPDYSSRDLNLGKNYTVAAIAGPGQVFAGWSGDTNCTAPRVTFRMKSGLRLEAKFIPSPFIPLTGSYTGLFYETNEVRHGHSGLVTVSMTSRGTYSGRLQLGAERYSFSGGLDLNCQTSRVIPRANANSLTLNLRFGRGIEADQIFGIVSDGNWTATVTGDRAVFNTYTNPAPYAGTFTLIVPGLPDDPAIPAGDGFGSLKISAAGRLTFSGTLADNSRISQTVNISKNGHWPFFASLYSGRGCMLSWLTFETREDGDITGLVSWIKPADPAAVYYPGGFSAELEALGSVYIPPIGDSNSAVRFSTAPLAFSGGESPASFTNLISLGLKDKVTNLSSNKLSMTFSRSSGRFSGRVTEPTTGLSRTFKGVVLQKSNWGGGYLLGTNQTRQVRLTP